MSGQQQTPDATNSNASVKDKQSIANMDQAAEAIIDNNHHNESSSNYDASIFEDEDGDTSSDILADTDKDDERRSLGTAQAQDQSGLLHLGST